MKGAIDQYDLLHAALFAIRVTLTETRVKSFQRLKVQPSTRTDFETWITKKRQQLEGGASFDHTFDKDKFYLLPLWWQSLEKSKKQGAMYIVKQHNGLFKVD